MVFVESIWQIVSVDLNKIESTPERRTYTQCQQLVKSTGKYNQLRQKHTIYKHFFLSFICVVDISIEKKSHKAHRIENEESGRRVKWAQS